MCEDPSCFGHGRSWEACCDAAHGPAGNQDCWLHLALEEQGGVLWEATPRLVYEPYPSLPVTIIGGNQLYLT